jgi:hypothetical protein
MDDNHAQSCLAKMTISYQPSLKRKADTGEEGDEIQAAAKRFNVGLGHLAPLSRVLNSATYSGACVTSRLATADYGETNIEDENGIKAEVKKEQENKKMMKNEVEVKTPQEKKGKMRDEVEAKDQVLEIEQEFHVKQEVFDNKEDGDVEGRRCIPGRKKSY